MITVNRTQETIIFIFGLNITFTVFALAFTDGSWLAMSVCFILLNLSTIYVLSTLKDNIISLYTIYMMGYLLFLGGRFISYPLKPDPIETNIFHIDYFTLYTSPPYESIVLFSDIYLSLALTFLGYSLTITQKGKKQKTLQVEDFRKNSLNNLSLLEVISIILGLYLIFTTISSIINVLNHGYMFLYQGDSVGYNVPQNLLFKHIDLALLSIMYSYYNKRNIPLPRKFKVALFLFSFSLIVSIFTGGRGDFICILMFLLMMTMRKKIFSVSKLVKGLIGGVGVIYITNLLTISTRFTTSGNLTDTIHSLFYGQGLTMMIFGVAKLIPFSEYPTHAIIKILIPGWALVADFFTLHPLNSYETNLASFVSWYYSAEMYAQNYGMGWSILGDFHVLSFGFKPLFYLYSLLLGIFMGKTKLNDSVLSNAVTLICSYYMFTLPRASISTPWTNILILLTLYFINKRGTDKSHKYINHESSFSNK